MLLIHSILMEFWKTSDCTDESWENETCVHPQFNPLKPELINFLEFTNFAHERLLRLKTKIFDHLI